MAASPRKFAVPDASSMSPCARRRSRPTEIHSCWLWFVRDGRDEPAPGLPRVTIEVGIMDVNLIAGERTRHVRDRDRDDGRRPTEGARRDLRGRRRGRSGLLLAPSASPRGPGERPEPSSRCRPSCGWSDRRRPDLARLPAAQNRRAARPGRCKTARPSTARAGGIRRNSSPRGVARFLDPTQSPRAHRNARRSANGVGPQDDLFEARDARWLLTGSGVRGGGR
jgi:hypothetical protein